MVDCGWCPALLLEPDHGNVRDANRRDLRALVPDSQEYLHGLLDAYDVRGHEATNVAQQRVR